MTDHNRHLTGRRLLLAAMLLATALPALAQYEFQRFLEDWSQRDGPAYKFIDLDGGGSLSLGGHLRLRSESHRNFRGSRADDAFTLGLATVHADYRRPRYRVFAELKAAGVLGENTVLPRGAAQDKPDIEQLFVDWKIAPGQELRLGRQTLLFPKPFLHTAKWRNTLRRWDGVTWLFQQEQWQGRAFWLQEALTDPDGLNRSGSDQRYAGVFVQRRFADFSLELYVTDFHRQHRPDAKGIRVTETRQTYGARFSGDLGPGRLSVESNLQSGRLGGRDILAQLYSASFDHSLPGGIKARLRLDIATGDNGSEQTTTGFLPVYDQVHPLAGRMDALWRRNLVDASVGLSRKTGPLLLAAELHSFQRENTNDAVYAPGGRIIAAADSRGRRIGEEVDLRANWTFNPRTQVQSGVSVARFADGMDTAARTATYLYLSLEHRF